MSFPNFITTSPKYQKICKTLHPFDLNIFHQILSHFEVDLFPKYGFFEEKDFDEIRSKALDLYFDKLITLDLKTVSTEDIRESWRTVVSDFTKNYWGYKKHQDQISSLLKPQIYFYKPPASIPSKPRAPTSYKDAFFYIWSVIQSLVIMKCLILIFGNELAKDDTLKNRIIFGLIIIISFGSLFVFAWLRRKKKYT